MLPENASASDPDRVELEELLLRVLGHSGIDPLQSRQERAEAVRKLGGV